MYIVRWWLGWLTTIAACAGAIPGAEVSRDTPYISEFLAINQHGIEDRYGARSDWIEIHNPSEEPFDLENWHLTDDPKEPGKWTFPATTLKARGFLLVFASGRGDATSRNELHANFRLAGNGGYLALARPDGSIAHQVADRYPPQQPDLSMGLLPGHSVTGLQPLKPTPRSPNSAADPSGPLISEMKYSPQQPQDHHPIVVTARVRPASQPVAAVTLHYRVMHQPEVQLQMTDDGTHGDGAAGDGVYAAAIPPDASEPGQMVRWVVTAADSTRVGSRAPPTTVPDAPQYYGTVIATAGRPRGLPILHWFSEIPNVGSRHGSARASLYYLGHFYDNVRVRRRGAVTTSGYKFDFNPGDHFQWERDGRRVEEININYASRLDETMLRPTLAFETFRAAGGYSCATFPLRLEFNGRFQRLAYFVENPDEDYLERQRLDPAGALYKLSTDDARLSDARRFEKRTRRWEDHRDLQRFLDGLRLHGPERNRFMLDHLDLPSFVNYLAANTLVNDNDCAKKNYMLYRDTEGDRRWRMLPWDKDLTFGKHFGIPDFAAEDPQTHPFFGDRNHPKIDGPDAFNRIIDAALAIPEVREMYLRRLRTVMDQLLQPPETPLAERYFEKRIEQLLEQIESDGDITVSAPRVRSGLQAIVKKYLPRRREHLYINHGQNTGFPDHAGIPPPQPANPRIQIAAFELEPPSRDAKEQFIALHNLETRAIDLSGWSLQSDGTWVLAPGTVIPPDGTLYIARDVGAFLDRGSGPRGGQGLLIVGAMRKKLPASVDALSLIDAGGRRLARVERKPPATTQAAQDR